MEFELRPEDVFAGHRIERVIGRGGMAVVYLAEHVRLRRMNALKVLHAHLANDPAFRERFLSESTTAARLEHPNIVTIYDADEEDGRLYISMQYVDGADLGKVLRDGPLEPSRTITIVSQVASALDTAYAGGLVHRDVKPANILLSKPGTPTERPFLTDFGIGKRLTTEQAFTRTGQFVGTVAYVAPEQIRGEPVDGRTDQYSLGCVLIECLSGRSPFQRETDIATIYAHLETEPHTVATDVPGMEEVIARTLAKDKEDRYPTCAALADAARSQLEAADETRVTTAPYEIPPERQQRGTRSWIALAIAAVVAIAIAVPLAILSGRDDPGADPRAQGPSSPGTTSPEPSDTANPGPQSMAINWNRFDWSDVERPHQPQAGQVVFTSAAMTGDGSVVAAGHADDPTSASDFVYENAAVWTLRGETIWVPRTVPGGEDPESNERIWDVSASDELVVAVGYDDGAPAAWYSEDGGRSWQQSDVPEDAGSMNAVVARRGGSGFSAFGHEENGTIDIGAAWRTQDGATWERVEEPDSETSGWFSGLDNSGNTSIAVGRSYEANGETDAAVWEEEGGSWVRVEPERFSAEESQSLLDVEELNGVAVAVGNHDTTHHAIIWTRGGDGAWVRAQVPGTRGRLSGLWAVTAVDGRFFVAAGWVDQTGDRGYDAAVWLSRDGRNWRRQDWTSVNGRDLSGPLFEEIRALLPRDDEGKVFAFGGEAANAEHDDSNAQVWIGSLE